MSAVTKNGLLFVQPYNKPLSTASQFQAGCYLVFTAGGVIAPVYRDPSLLWLYNQTSIPGSGPQAKQSTITGLMSDATGRFDPIYLNPALEYSYTLYSAAGVVLETGTNVNVSNSMQALEAVKFATTARANNTTLTNDPDLQINISAPASGTATYRIEADLVWGSSPASGTLSIELNFSGSYPSASPNVVTLYGVMNNAAVQSTLGSGAGSYTVNTTPTQNLIRLAGVIQVSTSGTFSIKWAQGSASSNALSLYAGSALYATLL